MQPELVPAGLQVQQQLESEAQIGGQACRSCLVPHLHKSQRKSHIIVLLLRSFSHSLAVLLGTQQMLYCMQTTQAAVQVRTTPDVLSHPKHTLEHAIHCMLTTKLCHSM